MTGDAVSDSSSLPAVCVFARRKAIDSNTDLNAGQIAGCHGSPNVVDCLAETAFSLGFFAAAFSFREEKRLQLGKFIAHEPR